MDNEKLEKYIMELGTRLADYEHETERQRADIADITATLEALDNRVELLTRMAKEAAGMDAALTDRAAKFAAVFEMMAKTWKEKSDE